MLVTLEILALVVLFLLDGFFSAAETAMTALPPMAAKRLAEKHYRFAATLEAWMANPGRLLTTVIISSNLAVITFSFVASSLTSTLTAHEDSIQAQVLGWVLSVTLSIVTLLAAEITPKVVAKRHAETLVPWILPGLQVMETLLGPVVRALLRVIGLIAKPFGGMEADIGPLVTEEELHRIVKEGEEGGVLEKEEREMIHSIMEFGDTLVREVMVPRTDMACISLSATVDEVLDSLIQGGYSRMPVYKDHFDNIVGILYSKDFLSVMKDRDLIILPDVIRPAYFVPETKKVAELLREFKRGRMHMAIVVDEHGGTAGLATLEDLLEEIVGEIRDEYDTEDRQVEIFGDGSAVVEARASLKELNAEMGLDLTASAENSTVGGFISEVAGKVPRRGETVLTQGMSFQVLEGTSRRVIRVKVRRENA